MGLETMAIMGTVASVAGTGLSAIGQMNAASAAQENANYQAEVARNNQVIAEQNARYANKAGEAAITAAQLKGRAKLGALTAALGASGIDVNTGSAAKVRNSATALRQLDTETTAQDAALKVYGFRSQGVNFGAQSGLLRSQAEQSGTAGLIGGGATLLSGIGGLAPKWKAWQSEPLGEWSPRSDAAV